MQEYLDRSYLVALPWGLRDTCGTVTVSAPTAGSQGGRHKTSRGQTRRRTHGHSARRAQATQRVLPLGRGFLGMCARTDSPNSISDWPRLRTLRRHRFCPALLALGVLVACLDKAAIWIDSPATTLTLTFGLAETRGGNVPVSDLSDVTVKTCYRAGQLADVYWEIRTRVRPTHIPTRIRYGDDVVGFTTWVKGRPLTPGCFEAIATGEAVSVSARFNVDSAGHVVESGRS